MCLEPRSHRCPVSTGSEGTGDEQEADFSGHGQCVSGRALFRK